MTLHRPRIPGPFPVTGRRYLVTVEAEYAGRTVEPETVRSLDRAIRQLTGKHASITLTVSPDTYSRLTVRGILTATTPLAAMARLDKAVDDALTVTGLFEEFDVTGKVLHAAPAELRAAK